MLLATFAKTRKSFNDTVPHKYHPSQASLTAFSEFPRLLSFFILVLVLCQGRVTVNQVHAIRSCLWLVGWAYVMDGWRDEWVLEVCDWVGGWLC